MVIHQTQRLPRTGLCAEDVQYGFMRPAGRTLELSMTMNCTHATAASNWRYYGCVMEEWLCLDLLALINLLY